MKWTTKDGQTLDVMSMDDNHAKNVLAMILRNNDDRDIINLILKGQEAYKAERTTLTIEPQGEIAQMMNEYDEELTYQDMEYQDWLWKD